MFPIWRSLSRPVGLHTIGIRGRRPISTRIPTTRNVLQSQDTMTSHRKIMTKFEEAASPEIKQPKRTRKKKSKETTAIQSGTKDEELQSSKVIAETTKEPSQKFSYTKHGKIAIKNYKSLINDLQMGRVTLPTPYVAPTAEDVSKKLSKRLELVNKRSEKLIGKLNRLEVENQKMETKQSLLSYINICVDAEMTDIAQKAFKFYNDKYRRLNMAAVGASVLLHEEQTSGDKTKPSTNSSKKSKIDAASAGPVIDLRHYNALLRGLAYHKSISNIEHLLKTMEYHRIEPNYETFGWYITAIGRHYSGTGSDYSKKLRVEDVFMKMKSHKLDPNELFSSPFCKVDDKEMIVKTIRKAYPNYKPNPPKYPSEYYGTLLKDFEAMSRSRYEPMAGIFASEEEMSKKLIELKEEQVKSETRGYTLIPSVAKVNQDNTNLRSLSRWSSDNNDFQPKTDKERLAKEWCVLLNSYRKQLLEAFDRAHCALTVQFNEFDHMNITPILALLKPQDFVDAMLETVEYAASSPEFSPPLNHIHLQIGERLLKIYSQRNKQKLYGKELDLMYSEYLKYLSDPALSEKYTAREWIQHVMTIKDIHLPLNNYHMESRQWPFVLLSSLGRFLCDLVRRECKIPSHLVTNRSFDRSNSHPHSSTWVGNEDDENLSTPLNTNEQNALFTTYIQIGNSHNFKEELHASPALHKLYQAFAEYFVKFDTDQLPMVAPPMPWLSARVGGYLRTGTDLIRQVESSSQQVRVVKSSPDANLLATLDSLTALSVCPWKINAPVLDIMINLFQSGGDESLDIPLNSQTMDKQLLHSSRQIAPEDKGAIYRARLKFKQKKKEMFSLWCDSLYRFSIANHFRDKIFWFPHNFDFRGRVYPVPPHFNHLGNDVARGMLMFAKGRPLGKDGLDWLKIHLVNLTGFLKKSSLEERLEYANNLMGEIYDSADNPLDGRRWWAKSDDPWQTLAACKEIVNAIRSGNPSEYVCYFPVHQDGSCNGLQHYAALGRDEAGAKSVNLMPCERPQDVYMAVCDIVEKERARDAANGNTVAQVLEGYIRRKTIKQTVMTTVYGVTRFGARAQIHKQLKDMDGFPERHIWKASHYVMQKTFFSYSQIFSAARKIQDWFVECASLIADKTVQPVQWVTPLGFLVIQPYHKPKRVQIYHLPGHPLVWIHKTCMNEKPNLLKQRNAFPPNYIHSLDSTHMMMTSLACERAGLTFVSVHDCYWTHPDQVPAMNKMCRDAFISLHSTPILEDLSAEMIHRASQVLDDIKASDETRNEILTKLAAVPKKGKFDLDSVRQSTFFFS